VGWGWVGVGGSFAGLVRWIGGLGCENGSVGRERKNREGVVIPGSS